MKTEKPKLGMMYHITSLCPRTDISLGRCGFSIMLYPDWRDAVKASVLTQADINCAIKNLHRAWLDGCGFNQMYDPDSDPMADWQAKHLGKVRKLGPNARHLYGPHDIRVDWGEWGPEHITVPGNACGLDLSDGIGLPTNGKALDPHNVDNFGQVILLLTVFTTLADHVIAEAEDSQR